MSQRNIPHALHVITTIIETDCKGPVRLQVVGNKTKITGKEAFVKAGYRSMPFESEKGELPAMRLAEVCPRILSFISQPHTLRLEIPSLEATYHYTPDLLSWCEPSLIIELQEGTSFHECTLKPFRRRIEIREALPMVFEVKRDDDSSLHDPAYKKLMEIVKQVYANRGVAFKVLRESDDLITPMMPTLIRMTTPKFVVCDDRDRSVCNGLFTKDGWASLRSLISALGAAKVDSLHLHRYVSIDLSRPISNETRVWKMLGPGWSTALADRAA